MNTMSLVFLIGIIVVGALFVYLLVAPRITINSELKTLLALKPSRSSDKRQRALFGARAYPVMDKMVGVNYVLRSFEKRLASLRFGEEAEVRSRAATYTFLSLLSVLGFILGSIFLAHGLSQKVVYIAAGFYVASVIQDLFITKMQEKSLEAQDQLLTALRDKVHGSPLILTALQQSQEEVPELAAVHAEAILDVLTSRDPETSLEEYYEVAPNAHMKKLAGVLYEIYKYGDDEPGKKGEESTLIIALRNVQKDLRDDILNRRRIRDKTSGTTLMAVFPVFCVDALKNWVTGNFSELQGYFDTKLAFYSTVILYISFLVSFAGVTFVRNLSNSEAGTANQGRFLNYLGSKKWIKEALHRYAPSHGQTVRSAKIVEKSNKILFESNSTWTIENLYLAKLLGAFGIFVLFLGVQINSHIITKHLMEDKGAVNIVAQTASDNVAKQKRVFESQLLISLAHSNMSDKEKLQYIINAAQEKRYVLPSDQSDDDVTKYADAFLKKVHKYQNEEFKWSDVVIALIAALIGYQVPNIYLALKSTVRKWDMQAEVDGFLTILEILSRIETVLVQDMLEWMQRYSSIFKAPLDRCIGNYTSGAEQALEELREEVKFPSFQRVVERLKNSINNTDIRDAFSDLEGDRLYNSEQKKDQMEKTIANKAMLANFFGWMPVVVLMVLYLLLPFLKMAMDLFSSTSSAVGGLGG